MVLNQKDYKFFHRLFLLLISIETFYLCYNINSIVRNCHFLVLFPLIHIIYNILTFVTNLKQLQYFHRIVFMKHVLTRIWLLLYIMFTNNSSFLFPPLHVTILMNILILKRFGDLS